MTKPSHDSGQWTLPKSFHQALSATNIGNSLWQFTVAIHCGNSLFFCCNPMNRALRVGSCCCSLGTLRAQKATQAPAFELLFRTKWQGISPFNALQCLLHWTSCKSLQTGSLQKQKKNDFLIGFHCRRQSFSGLRTFLGHQPLMSLSQSIFVLKWLVDVS